MGTEHYQWYYSHYASMHAKEWVEYPFNPIALASTAIAKESLFCKAITNAQCERNLTSNQFQFPDNRLTEKLNMLNEIKKIQK